MRIINRPEHNAGSSTITALRGRRFEQCPIIQDAVIAYQDKDAKHLKPLLDLMREHGHEAVYRQRFDEISKFMPLEKCNELNYFIKEVHADGDGRQQRFVSAISDNVADFIIDYTYLKFSFLSVGKKSALNLIKKDSESVGVLSYNLNDEISCLNQSFIRPPYRGQGIMSDFGAKVRADIFRAYPETTIECVVAYDNAASNALQRKFGAVLEHCSYYLTKDMFENSRAMRKMPTDEKPR